jgi:putative transposase
MDTLPVSTLYKNHRFPPEIISHAVWLYHRFCLSFRDVEDLLAARGVVVSYEAVRQWCLKFGQKFANRRRHRQGRPGDSWHLDELVVTIAGTRPYCGARSIKRAKCWMSVRLARELRHNLLAEQP